MNIRKSIWYIAALISFAFGFNACEKDSKGLTKVTYYADIQLEGSSYMVVNKNSEYIDPGYTAVMEGKDVTDQVIVTGEVDTSASGIYTVIYSIVNADGFSTTVSRTVVVVDLSDPIEGIWNVDPSSYRIYDSGSPQPYGGAFQLLILNNGDGTYYVEDLMAGWYSQRAGYGSDYNMEAVVTISGDGSITLEDSYVAGWGDSADAFENGQFDADGKSISYTLFYAGVIEFHVTLNKEELQL